jgi:hypothetical protein
MMFAWILILIPWVALVSLILHDATKEDSAGSAISIAARNFMALIGWAISKARKLWRALSHRAPPTSVSKPAVKVMAAARATSSSSIRQREPGAIKQAPRLPTKSLPPNKKWWRRDRRVSVAAPQLELAISEAVKKAAPGCEDFVGVIVRHTPPKSHLDPNWAVHGIRFGKTDRKMVNEALTAVVERMQQEFLLSDN